MTEQQGATCGVVAGLDIDDLRRALDAMPGRATASRRLAGVTETVREARSRGVEWETIVRRLAEVGFVRPDGRPLAISTVAYATRPAAARKTRPPITTASVPPKTAALPATAFSIPEVDALFETPADAPPVRTIDDYLEELNK